MQSAPKIVVTIARQLGSGGSYLGQRVAQKLGFAYLDREILREAAAHLGVEETMLEGAEERVAGFWERLLRAFELGSPDTAYIPPPIRPIPDAVLFETEKQVMRRLAAEQNCVVVGHAGFAVLAGTAGLVNVFVYAPAPFREKRVTEIYRVGAEEARSLVADADGDRERFIVRMTDRSWYDARNYHLSLDTERLGLEAAEEMILSLVERSRAAS